MDKSEVHLYEYWLVLQQHRRLILTVLLGTFLITAFFTFRSPNIYEAVTTFYFPLSSGKGEALGPVAQTVLGKEEAGLFSSLLPSDGGELQNYTKAILESRKIAELVDGNLRLTERLHFQRKNQTVDFLKGNTRVRLTAEGLMEVTALSTDPKLSADIANGYVDAYREYSSTSMLSLSKKHRIDVEQRIAQLKAKLRKAEGDMTAFQLKHKTADFTMKEKMLVQSLGQLQAEETASRIALQADEGSLRRVLAISGRQISAAAHDPLITPGLSDPIVMSLRAQLADVYVRYSQAKLTETPANPELKSYKAQLGNLETAIRAQLRRWFKAQSNGVSDDFLNLQINIAQIKAKQEAIRDGIRKLEKSFEAYPGVAVQYLRLERHLRILESLDTFLASEYEKARLEEAKESPDLQVLDKAVPPDSKIGPHRLYNLAIGFFLGMFLGVAAAFAMESFKLFEPPVRKSDGRVEDYELEPAERSEKN